MMARKINIKPSLAPANFSYADNISPAFATRYGINTLVSQADSMPTIPESTTEDTSTTTAVETPAEPEEAYPYRGPDKQMQKFLDMARNLPLKMR